MTMTPQEAADLEVAERVEKALASIGYPLAVAVVVHGRLIIDLRAFDEEACCSRYESPLGDRRERAVPCSRCGDGTWALDAICDFCFFETPDPHDRSNDDALNERYAP